MSLKIKYVSSRVFNGQITTLFPDFYIVFYMKSVFICLLVNTPFAKGFGNNQEDWVSPKRSGLLAVKLQNIYCEFRLVIKCALSSSQYLSYHLWAVTSKLQALFCYTNTSVKEKLKSVKRELIWTFHFKAAFVCVVGCDLQYVLCPVCCVLWARGNCVYIGGGDNRLGPLCPVSGPHSTTYEDVWSMWWTLMPPHIVAMCSCCFSMHRDEHSHQSCWCPPLQIDWSDPRVAATSRDSAPARVSCHNTPATVEQ